MLRWSTVIYGTKVWETLLCPNADNSRLTPKIGTANQRRYERDTALSERERERNCTQIKSFMQLTVLLRNNAL